MSFYRIVQTLLCVTIAAAGFSQERQVIKTPDAVRKSVKENPIYFVFEPISKKASKDTKWANKLADKKKYIQAHLDAQWQCSDSLVYIEKSEFDTRFNGDVPKVHANINVEETALELFVSGISMFRFSYVESTYCRDVIEDLISKACWAIQDGTLGNSQVLKTDTIYAKGYFTMGETKYVGGVNWADPWARKGSSTYKGGNYTIGGYADESKRAGKWLEKNYSYPVHLVTSREQEALDYKLKMYDVLLYNELRKQPEVNKDKALAKKVKQDFRNKTYPREPGHLFQSTWKLKSEHLNLSKKSVTITFASGFTDLTPVAYATKYEKVEMYKTLEEYLRFVK